VELGVAWSIPVAVAMGLIFLTAQQQALVTGAALSFVRLRRAKSSVK
jgi:hypothetical protein